MSNRVKIKQRRGERRRLHVRRHLAGTADRPRLTVSKTLRNTIAQLVDDHAGRTLAYWSTGSPGAVPSKVTKTEAARLVGKKIAELALAAGIKRVVFDRNRNRYHGRVKAVAEAAREAGLAI